MKKGVLICLVIVLGGLTLVPVVNLLSEPKPDEGWCNRKFLYNLETISERISWVLYRFGISISPSKAVIGRDGWLYLGDKHEKTRTVTRRGQTPADLETGRRIGAATEAWERWLAKRGVSIYRVMIGPDKGTIYPEYLPEWAKPSHPSATEALIAGTGSVRYIDLRTPLRDFKSRNQQLLYYRTDTHWNNLGAGVAFHAFAREVGRVASELRWPTDENIQLVRVSSRSGGDLANFLKLAGRLTDSEPFVKFQQSTVEISQYDFDSRQIILNDGNPRAEAKPMLLVSDGALNTKKVLWLHDSFGYAMTPLMAATFSDIVRLHWRDALKPGGRFIELVETWRPDFVFITVVERASRDEIFTIPPPPA